MRLYPADELIAADISIASPELRAQRLEALDHMLTHDKWCLYCSYCRFEKAYAY